MATGSTQVEDIRYASRELVRQLGFMGGHFAGTELSPSAVHALIEIGSGEVTARDLGKRLHLEKSSVSRMLRKLVESGDVWVVMGKEDGRVKRLFLTAAGKRRLAAINSFGRNQVIGALEHLDSVQAQTVLRGLRLYAQALGDHAGRAPLRSGAVITRGYRPGIIAEITRMHASYYARASGFGQRFESVVANGLADFCDRLENPRNAIWSIARDRGVIGSIAIDSEDLGVNIAHLRWFILDDDARGFGLGKQLLDTALAFADEHAFKETHLWTFAGLDAARHLYEVRGFVLVEERPGSQWGRQVQEQRFVRIHS